MKNTVTCKICGHKGKTLMMHLKHSHGISKSEYVEKYPDAKMVSESYTKNLKEGSRKGKDNPSYGKGRSCNSPFSLEFYKQRNPDKTEVELKQMLSDFLEKNKKGKDQNVFCLEYWLKKGFSESEAIEKREEIRFKRTIEHIMKTRNVSKDEAKKIQQEINSKWQISLQANDNIDKINKSKGKTFEQLVEKFGEDKASEIIRNRQTSKNDGRQFYSDASKKFFDRVVSELNLNENNIKRDKDEIWLFDNELKKHYYYDFCDLDKRLIVEFNGVFYHPKPGVGFENWVSLNGRSSIEVKQHDDRKKEIAIRNGFKVVEVWDDDSFETNKTKIELEYLNVK